MNMPEAYIPQDIYATLVTGAVVLVVLWLATFVVRKLIGVALAAALVLGVGWSGVTRLCSRRRKTLSSPMLTSGATGRAMMRSGSGRSVRDRTLA